MQIAVQSKSTKLTWWNLNKFSIFMIIKMTPKTYIINDHTQLKMIFCMQSK